MNPEVISQFLVQVRARINRGVSLRVGSWCLLAAGVAGLVWALAWRIFGYAAPWVGYAVIAVLALTAAFIWIAAKRRDVRHADASADETFSLKDGLVSWLDFRARDEDREAFRLHEGIMVSKVAGLDSSAVPTPKVRKVSVAGLFLLMAVIGLALLPHSEAVRKRLAQEELTAARTAEVAAQMEEAVEELIKQLSEEERELLDEKKLREWSKEIQQTKDAREAEKQFAKIEQQIAQTMQGLEARQDEAVLKLAAEELEKSAVADVRKLGKELDAKDFEKAAESLKDMKPESKDKLTPEELQKLRENAAKSKEMAKRMKDGAKKRDFGQMKKGDGKNLGAMKPSDGKQRPMQDMLDDLDKNARELDKDLADAEEMDNELQDAAEMVEGEMDELGKRLGKLGAREKAKGKLKSLRQGLADARRFSQGKAQALGLAQSQQQGNQPDGKRAGVGSIESRRNERDELKDNGNRVEVKGQDNPEGPSTNSVETAESGSGIAGRASVAKERQFKQQYESLVRRDDIPESLKLGIREYFETVHETQPEPEK